MLDIPKAIGCLIFVFLIGMLSAAWQDNSKAFIVYWIAAAATLYVTF
jgi:hypothetical protein